MGLFETVQLELFEFMGFKKPKLKNNKALNGVDGFGGSNNPSRSPKNHQTAEFPVTLDSLPYPIDVQRKPGLRGLRFNVSPKAVLQVSANKGISDFEILSLLKPHQAWIHKQVEKQKLVQQNFPQKKWTTGEVFPFSGRGLKLIFSPSSTKKAHIRFMENSFEYFYPLSWHEFEPKELQEKLHKHFLYFFKLKASEVLNERVSYWTEQMKLFPKSITYRNQKTRWGSCSSDGSVNLNWRLAAFNKEIQDYVIVHELAHLVHQNHSKKFWNLVEDFFPNRKPVSKRLQENALTADCYSSISELYEFNPGLE